MSEECSGRCFGIEIDGDLCDTMQRYIGQTVTIFTTSGGLSGCGFTGVLFGVNEHFVKLLTQIGPAPGCAVGNACSGTPYASGMGCMGDMDHMDHMNQYPAVGTVGSVVDIPIRSIASFVHNAV